MADPNSARETCAKARRSKQVVFICVLLAFVTVGVYWPVAKQGFINFDDPDYVSSNPRAQAGLTMESIRWAFGSSYSSNWHPLTWLSHMLDCQLYDLKPAGHHITNLLFHIANSLLLFGLLQRLTGALWRSAFAAALFALHPLHVESVAWVSERKDVLSAFFFLLTVGAYARYAEAQSLRSKVQSPGADAPRTTQHASGYYVLALSLFALGLMSKPMLVTLPLVMLLLDHWPLRRLGQSAISFGGAAFRRLVGEKVPFLALSLASCVVTFLAQRQVGAVHSLEDLPLRFRVANAIISYVRYSAKMIWPANLSVLYPLPAAWPIEWVLGAALLLAGITAWSLWRFSRAPYLAVGWFWYLGTLVPVIGLIQVGNQAMADRYTYIPLIGLMVMAVWSAAEIPERWPATRHWVAASGVAVLGACAVLTRQQLPHWRTSVTLFEHALTVTSRNVVAHNNLGACLLNEGNVAAAESHFAEAVRLRPGYLDAVLNLGISYERQGRTNDAFELVQRAAQMRPSPQAEYDLARLLFQQGKLVEAESHYQSALKLKPEFAEAWYHLGVLHTRQGRPEAAAQDYVAALRANPAFAQAHLDLGALLGGQKKFEEAIAHFNAVLRTDPDNADAHFNIAMVRNTQGDFAGAATHYAAAARLRPDDIDTHQNLALAFLFQGKLPEAATQFQIVLRARPGAWAHYYLALALDGQGQAAEAAAHYREAIRLEPKAPLYLNDLAWLLATCPRNDTRNGDEAVRLAEEACRLSGGKVARFWGTLDVAYAEAGRFEEAATTAAKARDLALAAGQPDIAQAAEERLALYRARKPYRTRALPAATP
jgi:tetratricopeptide (TPR) repeat protein